MSERTYKILIIDDDILTRTTLEALLENPNYHLEMAEDGIKGIEAAKRLNPDVILLDVMMPRMNGYDVCKRIRSDPRIGEVPIIMVTALDDQDAKLKGFMAGADDFLSKPFNKLELKIRLQTLRHVDRYRHLVDEREKLSKALDELSLKNEQLHTISRQTLDAQEKERRLVALELHDEIGQLLTGLKLILERPQGDAKEILADARAVTGELIQHVREMSLNLRPTALDDFGLSAALVDLFKRFTHQTRITVHHNVNALDDYRFDRTIETTVFRVTQEALTNIARHAGVDHAEVTLKIAPDHLRVSIADNGKGFDLHSKKASTSTGLSAMAERTSLAGGRFCLQSTPGKGTLVVIDFELTPDECS